MYFVTLKRLNAPTISQHKYNLYKMFNSKEYYCVYFTFNAEFTMSKLEEKNQLTLSTFIFLNIFLYSNEAVRFEASLLISFVNIYYYLKLLE
jgi:hypothetical protein